jgi:hypothetical protein
MLCIKIFSDLKCLQEGSYNGRLLSSKWCQVNVESTTKELKFASCFKFHNPVCMAQIQAYVTGKALN